jgi:hypothetical protein
MFLKSVDPFSGRPLHCNKTLYIPEATEHKGDVYDEIIVVLLRTCHCYIHF